MKTAAKIPGLDDSVADGLAAESETILALAEAPTPLPPHHPLMVRPAGRDSVLKTRLLQARRDGAFVDAAARRPVSLSAVLAAQQAIAELHGLRYVSARQLSRWVPADTAGAARGGGRSRNYLSVLLGDPGRGFPRLDWALIGHTFQVPAVTWEAADPVYTAWMACAAHGADLFRRGLGFFDQFVAAGGILRTRPRDPRASLTVVSSTRQIGAGGEPGMQHVERGMRVALQLTCPADFTPGPGAQVLIVERDSRGNVSLVSRAALVDDRIDCTDGMEIPPKRAGARPYLFFDTPGISTLYALIAADGGLDTLDLYRRTRAERLGEATVQPLLEHRDLSELRTFWLGNDPAACRVVRTRLEITG